MKIRHCSVLVLVLALLAAFALPAAGQDVVSVSIDEIQMDQFPQSTVLVTVRDANGVPLIGLGADKFEIVEDGRASFPPTEVAPQVNADAPVSAIMVIDISGSMEGAPIKEAMRAANAFLDQLGAEDRAAIIAFADEVQSLDPTAFEDGKEMGFTTDKNAIRNVVNFLDAKIGWDTPLYDAIYKGVKMAAAEPVGKRAVVVMTDGRDERDNAQGVPVKDTGSLSTPDDPINEANRHGIPIFTVGLAGIGGKIDTRYLMRLSERTGGIYQEAPKPEELTPLFENVVSQLKTQYVLGYESRLERDQAYHSLMVRVNLPQGQDFDEIKFQIDPSQAGEAEPGAGASDPAIVVAATAVPDQVASLPGSGDGGELAAQVTPEPEASGIQGIVDTVRDTIEEEPLIAVVIGAGVLLLLLLLVALLIVLLRGRRSEEAEYAAVDYGETYSPPTPSWTPEARDTGTPAMGYQSQEHTEVAPGSWGEPGPGVPAPAPRSPAAGLPPEIVEAGGTRAIERAPKHLAMLVDKARPDRKYDLKGTVNVGRGRDSQVVLDHPTVSRQHAWIKAEGEEFVVFDVGSANGTFVNGEQVEAPRRLQNGDVVRFGDAEFVFTRVF
ncbi:MAG: VWA domain-containing protein [Chloroflexi bacterium]|nr:MAG: VWA domain-containing protein [Chloroflexota bacterium]